ncbi:MAG TPA: hypothetical protein VNC59_03830 [Thermoanaerobaculia bacterium]|nr:hypothetical protein [Thermoanaerobaculia bacterium]
MIALDTNLLIYAHRSGAPETADEMGIRGPRIYDLQIALTAFDNGATEMWTHDRAFVPFPGLRVFDPLELSG